MLVSLSAAFWEDSTFFLKYSKRCFFFFNRFKQTNKWGEIHARTQANIGDSNLDTLFIGRAIENIISTHCDSVVLSRRSCSAPFCLAIPDRGLERTCARNTSLQRDGYDLQADHTQGLYEHRNNDRKNLGGINL